MKKLRRILPWLMTTVALLGILSTAVAVELGPAPEGSFSIVVLPDTQTYAAVKPKVFHAETQWIVDNLDRQRIRFVSHVGDIVDRNVPEQWQVAREAMDRLHGKVPYGFSVGNHDMVGSTGDCSLFQENFGASRFEAFPWYASNFKNNANSAQLFSAEGLDFVIVHLECNAPDDVLAWADEVLEAHSARRAIVTTHMYLGPLDRPTTAKGWYADPKGRMQWKKCHGSRGNTPEAMWQKCFSKHENLIIIFCGDQSRTQAMHRTVEGEHGNTVHEVLSDYHDGCFRLCRFLPEEDLIEVRTYRPHQDELCEETKIVADPEQHQFTLRCRMR
ncbi:MAG: metallophosphoesterase [Planctomycetes bacterium]|nr:metallophosphoesterase [Planctomycetota bacterium]